MANKLHNESTWCSLDINRNGETSFMFHYIVRAGSKQLINCHVPLYVRCIEFPTKPHMDDRISLRIC